MKRRLLWHKDKYVWVEEVKHQPHLIVVQIHEDELHGQDNGKDERATQRRNEHELYMQQVGSQPQVSGKLSLEHCNTHAHLTFRDV